MSAEVASLFAIRYSLFALMRIEYHRTLLADRVRNAAFHAALKRVIVKGETTVADIGAGTGYFSMRLAHFVPRGRVYAVDVETEMVKHLAMRAASQGLANVIAVRSSPDNPRLPGKVDLALVVDTYHHIEDREFYFSRLRGMMKPGGRLAVIDFKPDSPEGPPPAARLTPEKVKEELDRAGFLFAGEHDFLPNQYFLIFR